MIELKRRHKRTRKAVLYLYGPFSKYSDHPFKEDMHDRRDKLRVMSRKGPGPRLGLDIGYVLSSPTGSDEKPKRVLIARKPVFDKKGDLKRAKFKLRDIADYPVIVDHWVPNFRYKIKTADGIEKDHANGIGIEAQRLINHKNIQNYGNNKEAADRDLLQPTGAGLETFGVDKLEELKKNWGEGKVIFKPVNGTWGIGIEVFDTVNELELAIAQGKVPIDGLIQPYINLKAPIPYLKALTPEFEEQLHEVNSREDRVREIRMHFFVTTVNGERIVKAYPTLRTSEVGADVMKNQTYIPLDPEAFFAHYKYLYEKTVEVAQRLGEKTNVPHFYGVTDWGIGTHQMHPEELIKFILELNCIGPRIPDVSLPEKDITTPAQKEFVLMQKTMAREVFNAQKHASRTARAARRLFALFSPSHN